MSVLFPSRRKLKAPVEIAQADKIPIAQHTLVTYLLMLGQSCDNNSTLGSKSILADLLCIRECRRTCPELGLLHPKQHVYQILIGCLGAGEWRPAAIERAVRGGECPCCGIVELTCVFYFVSFFSTSILPLFFQMSDCGGMPQVDQVC